MKILKRYNTKFNDGYLCNILFIKDINNFCYWKLDGSKRLFSSLNEIEEYYKGKIKVMREY